MVASFVWSFGDLPHGGIAGSQTHVDADTIINSEFQVPRARALA